MPDGLNEIQKLLLPIAARKQGGPSMCAIICREHFQPGCCDGIGLLKKHPPCFRRKDAGISVLYRMIREA